MIAPLRRATAVGTGALAAVVWSVACVDFTEPDVISFGLPDAVVDAPTLVHDVQPILDRRCAFGGCHSAATRQAGLDLSTAASHHALVLRRARLNPVDTLVIPGASARSWLMKMLGSDETARAGVSRMPLAAQPLTANQLTTIARWIDRGAPRQ
ncbi:MAG: hypothetical protein IT359_08300 [Gemmatimonadaceae bacterium]|nr:hypothetical protein [Gemmatimonadaceae bacterium]